jgi:uncharacterized protein with GYD domain
MQSYLVQASYSSHALAALIKNPQNRTEHIRQCCEQFGGKLVGLWSSLGEHDIVCVFNMPDHIGAGAMRSVLASTGALKHVYLTPLYEVEDGIKALKLAATSIYKPVTVSN